MKILVAIDGSKESFLALQFSGCIPLRSPHFVLTHVSHFVDYNSDEISYAGKDSIEAYNQESEKIGKKIIEDAEKFCQAQKLSCEKLHLTGDVGRELVLAINQHKPDLVVMGSRGLNPAKKIVLGSVCDRVMCDTHSSFLIYRASLSEKCAHPEGKIRLLVGYDGSEQSEKACQFVRQWDPSQVDSLDLIHCIKIHHTFGLNDNIVAMELEPRIRQEMNRKMSDLCQRMFADFSGVNVQSKILEPVCDIPAELDEHATKTHKDLIVVGSQGKGLLNRILFGSVSHGIINRGTHPVLVLR